ncbi:N-acetyltransferase [bacterium]|nr:N-acetyltransferase [bacterium]|tara:strand:- start:9946 stop:10536 length:591 start_codon:yes stop_codon:yes gene_type:complete
MAISSSAFIHPTSIVDEGAQIGQRTKVWHWSHISSNALIGDNCSFGQNVFVGNNVCIGNNVKVQNNVSIYDNVILEDHVFCGPSMVFTNVYNPRSEVSRKNEYRDTLIKRGATLGANCTIVCGNEIGKYAFIGAGSLVNKNIKSFALVVGVPAKQIGWMSTLGHRIELPLKGGGDWLCPHSGVKYYLEDDYLHQLN